MERVFNVTGACSPKLHYMVDIQNRLYEIRQLIDRGAYFTMNRARQYGKTTTLRRLCEYLQGEYYPVYIDFQRQMSHAKFRSENAFSIAFAKAFITNMNSMPSAISENLNASISVLKSEITEHKEDIDLVELFQLLSDICHASDKPIVLIVDEVDSASNNQVFLDFLAQLRGYYLDRDVTATFQSVVLAGVYDIRNIKQKIRPEEDEKVNSPWNIAADFDVVMSFSKSDIAGMLQEYEKDHRTGMNIDEMAGLIYDYTSGYPFLVSRLCKLIDEKIAGSSQYMDLRDAWSRDGLFEAVKMILSEKSTLFDSLMGKLTDFPQLKNTVYAILFGGQKLIYNPDDFAVDIAHMFGFIKNDHGTIAISNRIFEMRLYNYFLATEEAQNSAIYKVAANNKNQYIRDGHLDMNLVMRKFVEHFNSIYGDHAENFDEEEGRKRFLLYIRPIINGTGNYYIEPETRNARRMDIVIDYMGEQFIVELKIWRGNAYMERGEQQLADYLEYFHLKKGYLLSYNFNKNKKPGVREIWFGDKLLVEAVV
jgi:hypothetical protein